MEILPGKTVMLTGASGGLGRYMATEFAAVGSKLALVAFPGVGLEEVRQAVTARGVEALAFTCDLRDRFQGLEYRSCSLTRPGWPFPIRLRLCCGLLARA